MISFKTIAPDESLFDMEEFKRSFLNTISIEVYASYSGNDATYKLINSVANDIMELVTADQITQVGSGGSSVGSIDNYNEVVISVQSISTQRVLLDNEIVIMKSIIIKFLLEEN
jgi:hypothetical protein